MLQRSKWTPSHTNTDTPLFCVPQFTSAVEKLHDTIRLALQPDPDVHHSTQTASAASAISSGRAPSPDQPTEAKLLVDLPFRILLYSDQEISALKASAADTPARREQRCRFLASANTTKARRFLPLGDQELKVFLQLQQVNSPAYHPPAMTCDSSAPADTDRARDHAKDAATRGSKTVKGT